MNFKPFDIPITNNKAFGQYLRLNVNPSRVERIERDIYYYDLDIVIKKLTELVTEESNIELYRRYMYGYWLSELLIYDGKVTKRERKRQAKKKAMTATEKIRIYFEERQDDDR